MGAKLLALGIHRAGVPLVSTAAESCFSSIASSLLSLPLPLVPQSVVTSCWSYTLNGQQCGQVIQNNTMLHLLVILSGLGPLTSVALSKWRHLLRMAPRFPLPPAHAGHALPAPAALKSGAIWSELAFRAPGPGWALA